VSETKTCQDCIDLLADYVDGALSADLTSKLEEHIGGCQPCEDFLSTYRATTSVCRKAMARAMPATVATKLHAFLRQEIGKDKASGS
jgi:anti-sigma factor RsiW